MKISGIFHLQDRAAPANIKLFKKEFNWCERSVELMLDTHVFLANDPEMVAYRRGIRNFNIDKFRTMNVIVNLGYDAVGSLISALRLMGYGVIADAWSLIRGAFESTCYAEFFALNTNKVKDYLQIAETINRNHSANILNELRDAKLTIGQVRCFLEKHDSENRTEFYARLCNFGTHASPVRSGFRIKKDEPEVRAYLSIGHRDLIQCLTDFAATTKYTMGIPFDTWPDLMRKKPLLLAQYAALEEEYKIIYPPV